ncbi:MAG: hypothetical protein R8P61_04200 [Bacteroidia bacterium]|nr:hypothetical protein [Bacteroidia bacterium]
MRTSIVLFLFSISLLASSFAQEPIFRKHASRIIVKMVEGVKVEGILYAANDSSIWVWEGLKKVKALKLEEKNLIEIPARNIHKIKLISRQEMEVLLFSGIAIGAVGGTIYGEENGYGVFSSVPFGFLGGLTGLIIALVPNDIKQKGTPYFRDRHLKKLQKQQLISPINKEDTNQSVPVISLSSN